MSLTAVGTAAMLYGASVYFMNNDSKAFFKGNEFITSSISNTGHILPLVLGAACLGVGIPIWISGDKQVLRMLDTYNDNLRHRNSDVSLNLGVTNDGGLGFILKF